MNDSEQRKVRNEVWDIVKRINKASRDGDIPTLRHCTHEKIVVVPPGFEQRTSGKDVYLQSVEEFASRGTVYEYTEHEPSVDIFNNTVIVTYRYKSVWGRDEEKYAETGHDVWVLIHQDHGWVLAWRTLVPSKMEKVDEE